MSQPVSLNDEEYKIVLAALQVVSPSGGGSPQYTLYRKLAELHPHLKDDANDLLHHFSNVVVEGWKDANEDF